MSTASVRVGGELVAEISNGLMVLVGVAAGDVEADAHWIADKLATMRVFADAAGRFDRSVQDLGGQVLLVSQFTLYADTRKGRRPSFNEARRGDEAEELFDAVFARLAHLGVAVQRGVFGADMQVSLINEGPVTIIIESPSRSEGAG